MMTAWLIRLGLSKSAAGWSARLLGLLAVAVLCAVLYGSGYSAGRESKMREAQKVQLAQAKATIAQLVEERERNDALTAQLKAEQQRERVVYRTIRQEVPRVLREIVEVPASSGTPQCRVGVGYVSLWDAATFARLPEPAGGAAHGVAATGAAQEDSGVGFTQLLDNHVDNAEVAASVRQQCEALIQWHRERMQ